MIPLFQKQLARGGPMTVTHPNMERYFMTVPEAVELVLRSATLSTRHISDRSNIFVLDMGKPVKILDLAHQMIRLSGLDKHKTIDIEFIGIRAGEKLYEELFYDFETALDTKFDSIVQIHSQVEQLDQLKETLSAIANSCEKRQTDVLKTQLIDLVPQYNPHHTGSPDKDIHSLKELKEHSNDATTKTNQDSHNA